MYVEITMPQLGLTMTEGTVSTWLKSVGDTVKKDEIVLAVATDKVDMDVEATADGVLTEIFVNEGETVPVGARLAILETAVVRDLIEPARTSAKAQSSATASASQGAAINHQSADKSPNPPPAFEPVKSDKAFIASPRAKRKAKQLGIDISILAGTGTSGRIVEADVIQAASHHEAVPSNGSDHRRRLVIADRMAESVRTIPAFTLSIEVNAENLVSLYRDLKGPVERKVGAKLTYTDLFLKALGLALKDEPGINSRWLDGAPQRRDTAHFALAVATDRGVVAPVLLDVHKLSIEQIALGRSLLTEKARQGRLSFSDMEGASGSLSNLGMYAVDSFQGIITPGQSFILAIGSVRPRPWVQETLVIRSTVTLTLSIDHRVADGAQGAVFLQRLTDYIENSYQILWQPAS